MSALMKGFNIPKHSGDTNIPELYKACIKVYSNGTAELVLMKTKEHYPLIDIPTPHGDLIDRDDLLNSTKVLFNDVVVNQWSVINAPTIIKAEE